MKSWGVWRRKWPSGGREIPRMSLGDKGATRGGTRELGGNTWQEERVVRWRERGVSVALCCVALVFLGRDGVFLLEMELGIGCELRCTRVARF